MTPTGDVGELDPRGIRLTDERAPVTDGADPAPVGSEQALTGPVNRPARGRAAPVDVSWGAESANVGAEPVA